MATIVNLVAKLNLDNNNFTTNAAKSAQKMADLGAKAVQCNAGLRVMNSGMTASSDLMDSVDNKAKGAVKTLLKLGSAAAMVATAVKAAHSVDRAQANLATAKGEDAGPGNTAVAYDRVSVAVTRAYEAFGQAFSRSVGLSNLLDQMANIVIHLTPTFEFLGSVLGRVVSYFASSTPAAAALLFALKGLAIACGALVFVAGILIKRQLIIWLTGASPLTWLLTAAQWALNAAWAAGTIAVDALMAAGWPVFIAIAAVIGTVLAVAYGLYKVWKLLTSAASDGGAESAKQTEKMAKSMNDAAAAAAKIEEEVNRAYEAAKNDAATNKVEELATQMSAAGVKAAEYQRRITALDTKLADTAAITSRTQALKEMADIHEKMLQSTMTPNTRTVANLAKKGANVQEQMSTLNDLGVTEGNERKQERLKALAQQIADIEKASRQAGMTDAQKKIDDFFQIARLTDRMANANKRTDDFADIVNAAERKNEIANQQLAITKQIRDLEFEAATIGLTAGQQALALAKQRGAQGELLEQAQQQAAALDQANETKRMAELAKHLTDSTATPLEKYRKQVEDIQKLLEMGAIGTNVAQNAMGAADTTFMSAMNTGASQYRMPESPTAIIKGSAEADLAANRQKLGPVKDAKTELAQEQLKTQQEIAALARQQIEAIKANKPVPDEVADLN